MQYLLLILLVLGGIVASLGTTVVLASPGTARLQYELWQGDRRLDAGEYGAARRHFLAASEAMPQDPAPHARLAQMYWKLGRVAPAKESWQAALNRDPHYTAALVGLGMAKAAQQSFGDAVQHFQAALDRAPTLAEARRGLAEALAQQGDLAAARAEWERLLATNGLSAEITQSAHYGLAMTLLPDQPEAASEHLQIALRVGARAVAPAHLSSQLTNAALLTNLISSNDRAVDNVIAEAHYTALLGYAYLLADHIALADQSFARAVSLSPRYADALAYLGYTQWMQGDVDRSLASLDAAVAASSSAVLPRYFKGIVLRAASRFDEAYASQREAAQLDPANPALLVEFARTLVASGDYAAAASSFEQALTLNPSDAELLQLVATFYLDHLFRVDRGLAIARDVVRQAPASALAHDTLGWATYLNGNYADGIKELERAANIDHTLVSAHFHLAVVHQKSGDRVAAGAAYRRVVDLDVGNLADQATAALAELTPTTLAAR